MLLFSFMLLRDLARPISRAKARAKAKAKPLLWPDRQKLLFGQLGISWPAKLGTFQAKLLTLRDEGVLAIALANMPEYYGLRDAETCIDTSQLEDRIPIRTGGCPCIMPLSKVWLCKRLRIMLGVESLLLQ